MILLQNSPLFFRIVQEIVYSNITWQSKSYFILMVSKVKFSASFPHFQVWGVFKPYDVSDSFLPASVKNVESQQKRRTMAS